MLPFLNHYKSDITKYLTRFLDKKRVELGHVNAFGRDSMVRAKDTAIAGKIIRGSLACFAYKLFGGTHETDAIKLAAALELIQTGLVIHDDIMDHDLVRRGQPTLYAQVGEDMALCVGDLLFFSAMEVVGSISTTTNHLSSYLGQEFAMVCTAQMQDVAFSKSNSFPKKTDILSLYTYKTARYTFAVPLVAGARLAGANTQTIETLSDLGTSLGILFQIRDDYLGTFGETKQTGKSVGGDIREGKKTLAFWYLFDEARPKDRKILEKIFGNRKASDYQIKLFKQIASMYDIEKNIEKDIRILEKKVKESIEKLSISPEAKNNFLELLAFVLTRKS